MIDPEQAVAGPAGPAPLRPASSIRRTATIDMTWPGGAAEALLISGRARDAVTSSPSQPPEVVATASTRVEIGADRTIRSITATPSRPGMGALVGCRGGGHLRAALDDALPGERRSGTPLYLLLDDVSGTSLIAGVAWSRWPPTDGPQPRRRIAEEMAGVCIGFRPGSSALVEIDLTPRPLRAQPVGSLVHPDDPDGWHELAALPAVSTRRARFIDARVVDGTVIVDSGFQDSVGDPDHGRVAIHEYRLRATADVATMTLRTVEPEARVLPFRECPAAVATSRSLIGAPLAELRQVVLDRLGRTNGCTHLNDALRALAEVPVLVAELGLALARD